VWPTLVVFVEAPADVIADRLNGRELDRFERAGDEFHERVLDGFRSMADADPDRWVTISADGTKDATAAQILAAVRDRLAVGEGAAGA
jgi:dTMP kinase